MIGLKENKFEIELPVKLIPLTWDVPAVPEVTPLIVPACVELDAYKNRYEPLVSVVTSVAGATE